MSRSSRHSSLRIMGSGRVIQFRLIPALVRMSNSPESDSQQSDDHREERPSFLQLFFQTASETPEATEVLLWFVAIAVAAILIVVSFLAVYPSLAVLVLLGLGIAIVWRMMRR